MGRLVGAIFAALLTFAATGTATAQPLDLDTRLRLPTAAKKDDASRLFWLKNAGKVARARDDLEGSRLAWEAALPLAEKLYGPEAKETEAILFELGLAFYSEGQLGKALPVYQRDYALRRTLFGPDSAEALITLSNIAACYAGLGRDEDALAAQEQIYAAGLKARGEADNDVLIDRNNLASSYARIGRTTEAEAGFRDVIRQRRAAGDNGDQLTIATGNLVQLLNDSGRPGEVGAAIRDAGLLDTIRQPETGQWYVTARHYLAWQYARSLYIAGHTEQAIAVIRPTVRRSVERIGPQHPDTIRYERQLADYLFQRAREVDDEAGSHALVAEALDHARAAAQGLEQRTAALGFSTYDEAVRSSDSTTRTNLYSLLAVLDGAMLSATGDQRSAIALQDEAIRAIQRAMDGTASRAVAETAARNAAAGQGLAPLVEERQALADKWSANEAALAKAVAQRDAAGEAQRIRLVEEGKALQARLAAVDARLHTEFPAYFDLIRPEPLGRREAADLVRPDEAVLLVLPTYQQTLVMLVTSEGIGWSNSQLTVPEIETMTRRLLWDVGGNVDVSAAEEARWADEGEGAYPFDRKTAWTLYKELVGPNAEYLAGKRHLFVVAGGALSSLPFGMLVTEEPQGADGDPEALRQTSWFADKIALIQLPSLQSLAFLRKYERHDAKTDAGVGFLGFGDPVLEGAPEPRGGRGKDGRRRRTGGSVSRGIDGELTLATIRRMVRLPGTAAELEAMRKAMTAPMGRLYTGARATEANFRHADLASANVIALATHGLMAGELAGNAEPGLIFTPPAVPAADNDGYLSASEIAGLRFSADWVILSACNTAAGDGKAGAPGLSGLARAFFYAGAGSLLASHWPVRDDVAARLTVRSIEIRRDNPDFSRAEALQRAMREIRLNASHDTDSDTWAHPSAWAPFTLVGDGTR